MSKEAWELGPSRAMEDLIAHMKSKSTWRQEDDEMALVKSKRKTMAL